MALYCDESGGLSAPAMTFAALAMTPEAAEAVIARFRAVTGLRGELKGSRISVAERALLFEILVQHDVRGWIALATGARLAQAKAAGTSDFALYSALLEQAVAAFMLASGGACADVIIDAGRYDPRILGHLRQDIQSALGQWGQASLADSRRCAGIQIADVLANSQFNIAAASPRAVRIAAMMAPWLASGRLTILPLP